MLEVNFSYTQHAPQVTDHHVHVAIIHRIHDRYRDNEGAATAVLKLEAHGKD